MVYMRLIGLLGLVGMAAASDLVRDFNRGNPASLRLDVSSPVLETNLVAFCEVDYEVTADLCYEFRQHISDSTRFRLVWGMSLANTVAEASQGDSVDLSYWGMAGRYHLGFSYELNDRARIQLVPYIGAGVGYLQVDGRPDLTDSTDDNYLLEYGAQLHFIYEVGALEVGAGVSWTGRRAPHYLQIDRRYEKWVIQQDYPAVHLTVGWVF